MDAETVAATLGLYNKIVTNMIDVDSLVAREAFIQSLTGSEAFINRLTVPDSAFIQQLYTSRIFGGDSLQIIAGKANDAARVFRQEEYPGADEAVKPGDMLVKPSTGQQYQAVRTGEIQFALDKDGNLYYRYDGDGSLMMQGFDLYAEDFALPVDENGSVFNEKRRSDFRFFEY